MAYSLKLMQYVKMDKSLKTNCNYFQLFHLFSPIFIFDQLFTIGKILPKLLL